MIGRKKRLKLNLWFCLLLIFILFLCRSFFTTAMPVTHDLEIHLARAVNYYLALKQGQFPPRWAPNINDGFGYPVFIFAYPVSHVVTAFLYVLDLPIEVVGNLYLISLTFFGAFGLFSFAYLRIKNYFYALLASLVYLFAPYTMLNLFIRGAIGELTFWTVLPWLLIVLELKRHNRKWWYAALVISTFSIFLLSHNLSLMVALPLLITWFTIDFKRKFKEKEIVRLVFYAFISFLIVQFYWLPMIGERGFTVVRKVNSVVEYWKQFPKFKRLLWSSWGYGSLILKGKTKPFTVRVGLAPWMLATLALIKIVYRKKVRWRWFSQSLPLIFWLVCFFASIFLMTSASQPIWEIFSPLKSLQFPWRLLWLAVFSSVMLFIIMLENKILKRGALKILAVVILGQSIYSLVFQARPARYVNPRENHFWLQYSGAAGIWGEVQPIWFNVNANLRLSEFVFIRPKGKMLFGYKPITSSIGQVENLNWTGSIMSYQVKVDQEADIIQRTEYFPGWKAWVDGRQVEIQFNDLELPGRIIIPVSAGKHNIKVRFTNDTIYRRFGDGLSLGGLLLAGLTIFYLSVFRKISNRLSQSFFKRSFRLPT